jgi:heme-degrading monooxygenase HmoA
MIARVWMAHTTPGHVHAYAVHFRTRVLPQLRSLAGYAGAWLLRRDANGETELIVVTRWRSKDAVRAFAGDDVDAAVVEDAAAALLSRFDVRVRHYEIVADDA